MTITEKRALLLREWLLAKHGNNEDYYYATLFTGVPDGDDYDTVLDDLKDGFYDDDIDRLLKMYKRTRNLYGDDGWYVDGRVIYEYLTALKVIEQRQNITTPNKIYKRRAAR